MSGEARPLRLALISGEASGDALAASLVRELHGRGVAFELIGVGGAALETEGLKSFFPQTDIAIMGVAAVLQRLPLLLRRISETARTIADAKPDLLLTIDAPDFCLRVAKKVRARAPGIPIAHWICPTVWAWRPKRARRMKPHVDRVLCFLPFEPEELRKLDGPPGVYVGHPLIERLSDFRPQTDEERVARADASAPEILLLPGSRRSEVSRLISIFGEVTARIARDFPQARFSLPVAPHVRELVANGVRTWSTPVSLLDGEQAKLAAFRRARVALAASGTVTLELALAKIPTVGVYRLAEWEAMIARRLLRVHSVLMSNLVLGENAVPELLQENCTPDAIMAVLSPLIGESSARAAQLAAFDRIEAKMRSDGASPSAHVADEILGMIAKIKTPR
ncbi:lipid-A-disaccharide synthase [Terrarubrum flagellatum]|uniref:lipid-A-disaccharide synthase n=1 Tax=Terrirubrum flagellatum TaxID=2895980 RepID=UPI0031452951